MATLFREAKWLPPVFLACQIKRKKTPRREKERSHSVGAIQKKEKKKKNGGALLGAHLPSSEPGKGDRGLGNPPSAGKPSAPRPSRFASEQKIERPPLPEKKKEKQKKSLGAAGVSDTHAARGLCVSHGLLSIVSRVTGSGGDSS